MKKISLIVLLLVAVSTYVSAQVRPDTTKRNTPTRRTPTTPPAPGDTIVTPGNPIPPTKSPDSPGIPPSRNPNPNPTPTPTPNNPTPTPGMPNPTPAPGTPNSPTPRPTTPGQPSPTN